MGRTRTIALCVGTLAVVVAGCQSSGVGQRKAERMAAYQSLSAETRKRVDKGKIQDGMDTNGVYIAWGRPTAVLQFDIPAGKQEVWTYERKWTFVKTERIASDMDYHGRPRYKTVTQRIPTTYAARSVVFIGGKVVKWKESPPPYVDHPMQNPERSGRVY